MKIQVKVHCTFHYYRDHHTFIGIVMQSNLDVMQFRAETTKSLKFAIRVGPFNNIQINNCGTPLLSWAKSIY